MAGLYPTRQSPLSRSCLNAEVLLSPLSFAQRSRYLCDSSFRLTWFSSGRQGTWMCGRPLRLVEAVPAKENSDCRR